MKHCYKRKKTFLKQTLVLVVFVLVAVFGKAQLLNAGSIGSNPNPFYGPSYNYTFSCFGDSARIYNRYSPSGGVGTLTYTWQQQDLQNNNWVDIPNTNQLSYTTTPWYKILRRKVADSLGNTAFTSSVSTYICNFNAGSIGFKRSETSYTVSGDNIFIPIGYTPPQFYSLNSGTASGVNTGQSVPVYYDYWYGLLPNTHPSIDRPYTSSYVHSMLYTRRIYSQECSCINESGSYTSDIIVSYLATNPYDAGIVIPNSPVATIGNTINFNASTLPTGGTPPYYYQWQDSIPNSTGWNNIVGAENATYQTILTQHKFFRRRAWDNVGKIAFSGNVYQRSINAINLFVNTNVNAYTATNVSGNYWYDIADAAGNVVASINPGSNNLGTVTVQMKHFGAGVASIPTSNSLIPYMPRYFEISSSAYPTGNIPTPVGVKLYYKNSELADFKTKIVNPTFTTNDLRISHYHGANQDCDVNNNTPGSTVEITPTNATFADGFYVQFNANSFSEFGAVSKDMPLPVTWMNFTGNLKDKTVQLNWNVANQTNNKGFEVQRSSNGSNFQSIGFVNASTATTYNFTDAAPLANTNFYRLRQVDNDGKAIYSNTITIRANSKNKFTVFPNPITDGFTVQAATTENIKYNIVNASGQIVSTGITTNNKKIDVSALPKGTYALQLFTESDKQVFKIVRQ
jgi:Secretion system C-terminal sorting domain